MSNDEIQRAAQALFDAVGRPRRRANPRVARALHEARYAMIDGVAAWRLGEGPAVLLVHGWEDDTSLFGPMIEALVQRGRAVAALDLPAHGYSEGDRVSLDEAAHAVAAVARAMGPVTAACGHSFGCKAIGFAVAEHGFSPQRLVLIGSPVSQRAQWTRIGERVGAPAETLGAAIALMEAQTGRPLDHYDLARLAPGMSAHALFVHSLDDEACPLEDVQGLAEVWPGARTLFVDGMGHRLVAQHPEIVAAAVDFLDR